MGILDVFKTKLSEENAENQVGKCVVCKVRDRTTATSLTCSQRCAAKLAWQKIRKNKETKK